MKQHTLYMQRCIELAKKGIGNTYPNPLVGSLIVKDNQIIGEGYHRQYGEAHAEINAINSVVDPNELIGATIYVTLEPCAHYGKTPPCAERIVTERFAKVIVGATDSHDKVNGKGIEILKNAGIEVVTGVLEEECRELNKRFFTYHEHKRPYIILKWAESADHFIDKDFQPTPISDTIVNQYTHYLRSTEHAILVGKNTVLHDNPSLTTRNIAGKNPIRILIDKHLEVSKEAKIFDNSTTTIVINSQKSTIENHIEYIKLKDNFAIKEILDELYQLQIQSVIIEGGAFTLRQFIQEEIWDEAIVIRNNRLFLGSGTRAPILSSQNLKTTTINQQTICHYTRKSK